MPEVHGAKAGKGKVVSLSGERAKRPVPSLKELCALDKDIKEFFLLIKEEELREEALRLLNREITKKRPIPMSAQK
jgi:hypothetical protein